jgi:anti-sigma factor ChrR (cupin superfamily)
MTADKAISTGHGQTGHLVKIEEMEWTDTKVPGIKMKALYSDNTTGMSTILFKLAPGAVVPKHEHTSLEQTYVLEGTLEDHEGAVAEGQFIWRPGGSVHTAVAPNGAVILCFFTKPNRFVTEMDFYV